MTHPAELSDLVDQITAAVRERLKREGLSLPKSPVSATASSPATAPSNHPCGAHLQSSACGQCSLKPPEGVIKIVDGGIQRLGKTPGDPLCWDVANIIDHTLLDPAATRDDLKKVCDEARKHCFASVCVNSANVRFVASQLRDSGVITCAVVGFPLGAMESQAKAFETKQAVRDGAGEIDMVLNIGALKSREYELVADDIKKVVQAAHPKTVKVILETSKLTDDEKAIACALAKNAGAHFVKTSTGFGGGGATVADVQLMRRVVGADMGVKASGGVRDRETLEQMVAAGANRVGASASIAIVSGQKSAKKSGY